MEIDNILVEQFSYNQKNCYQLLFIVECGCVNKHLYSF